MNKVNQIKLKNFPFAQHESNKQGDKPTLRIEKKIFANEIADKELICKIYKQLMQLN